MGLSVLSRYKAGVFTIHIHVKIVRMKNSDERWMSFLELEKIDAMLLCRCRRRQPRRFPLTRNPPHGAATAAASSPTPTDRPNARAQSRIVRELFRFFRSWLPRFFPRRLSSLSFASASPRHDYVRQPRQLGRLHRRFGRSVRGPFVRPNSENGNDGWHGLRASEYASKSTYSSLT